jgi:hypothetical protein
MKLIEDMPSSIILFKPSPVKEINDGFDGSGGIYICLSYYN